MSIPRQIGMVINRCFAWNAGLARRYLEFWAWLLDFLPDGGWLKRHIGNNLRNTTWPHIQLAPQSIELTPGVSAKLRPATGSLSFRALYERRLQHEQGMPEFLAERLPHHDAVLEIGANVGVYTLLFSKCLSAGGRVISFEPSPRAFAQLQEHLVLNECRNVTAYNAAVTAVSGTVPFYPNSLDLMKGSLIPTAGAWFAGHRADPINVRGMNWSDIAPLVNPFTRLLVKVDVVGSEPEVLSTLQPLIASKTPDIVVGIWQQNLAGLNKLGFLREHYRFFRIDPQGLTAREQFEDASYCNYFLEPISS